MLVGVLVLTGLSTGYFGDDREVILAQEQLVRKKTTVRLSFDLPEVPQGKQVRLSLDARVNYPSWCANNPAMVMDLNGKNIVGADLINKPLEYHCKNGRDSFWATPEGCSWYLFSWPDFSMEKVRKFASPYAITETDPFHFEWDVTRYVHLGKNAIRFTHNEIITQPHSLVLRRVRVLISDPIKSNSGTMPTPAPTGPVPRYIVRGRQKVGMGVELSPGGSLRLKVCGCTFCFTSRLSQPEGKWATTTETSWQAVVRSRMSTAQWLHAGTKVTREVSVRDDHIHVADTFSNTTDKLIGVMYEHQLNFHEKPLDIKLAGRPPYASLVRESGGANPTALAQWKEAAIGLVAEDDVFRAHACEFVRQDALGIGDHELGLEPGQSCTTEWSIYPVPRGDYWDFINAVRRNWGANFTLPGLHVFVDWSSGTTRNDDYYRNWIERRSVRMVTPSDTMFDKGYAAMGTAIPLAKQFCARTAAWMQQVHRIDPQMKRLFYMNCTLSTEPDSVKKYADSRLLDTNGNQVTVAAGSPQGVTMAPAFVSTPENSYGKAMMNVVHFIIENLKADGLYHDLLCSYGNGSRTHNAATWDGCTVIIDPQTHAVVKKASSVALLQQPWHAALVKYLRDRGKLLFGNGPVETRTMLNLKVPAFVETCFSYSTLIDTHLGAPWGYGNHNPSNSDRNRARMVRGILDYGGVFALSAWEDDPRGPNPLQFMYPFTPVELHPGVVIGEERILTTRSGLYGWPDNSTADVIVFDGDGRLVRQPFVKEIRESGCRLIEVRMPSDHFAILVRKSLPSRRCVKAHQVPGT